MSSRQKILEAVLKNQPQTTPLPDISVFKGDNNNAVQKYIDIFKTIGGSSHLVENITAVKVLIKEHFDVTKRIVTTLPELSDSAELLSAKVDPHSYEDVELAVL
ncbi:MAG TPA: lactate utilization protein B/C, partial [Segetibacter sp.]